MSLRSWPAARSASGFTLIEVIGALVIFSLGVLMVIQVSGALGTQMRYAGTRSELVVHAAQILDSLAAEPFASVTVGTRLDTLVVQGVEYECTVLVAAVTPVLKQVDVSLEALDVAGPSHAVTSYVSAAW
ncbi:MAG TPA: prepilin-type N-terminal cleavage/methylation domain-containing protein [Longimicrobiales bacterium]|nr:prepilin-type N-terminal cleavage/methylation domain-containing protein [Longimicrobiales bacterium]